MTPLGAVVLCGGRSRRMGRSKAWLPFGDEVLLTRVTRVLAEVAGPVVAVAAPGQTLPPLPEGVAVHHDPEEGRGPLQGIAVGLRALEGRCERAFVSSTDAPFLHAAFIRRLHELARDHDIAVVRENARFHHPLAAIYRPSVAAVAERLLAEDRPRPFFLFEASHTRFVSPDELLEDEALRALDPELHCLDNLNTPEDYEAALARLSPGRPTSS